MSEEQSRLQSALETKDISDTIVNSAHGVVDAMNQVNDDAQAKLARTTRDYTNRYSALSNGNQIVAKNRKDLIRA